MPNLLRPNPTLILLSGILAVSAAACGTVGQVTLTTVDPVAKSTPPATPDHADLSAPASPSAVATSPSPNASEPYAQAIARASSAFNISQSATSQDDWRLVASRWQQAIQLMTSVPAAHPNHTQAQAKIVEYRRNLVFAEQQANRSTQLTNPDGVVVISTPSPPNAPTIAAAPQSPVSRPSRLAPASAQAGVFRAPIVRRAGGTPVINVTFNGDRTYEMIVDTGASGTLITPQMATALGVVPVGRAQVDTASAQNVSFPLGYINTMQVEGVVARNVLVAVAGPELGTGLLGHDFFGNYDVTIRQHEVEFQMR